MSERKWQLNLNNEPHLIEFRADELTGSRHLIIDGATVESGWFLTKLFNTKHLFKIRDHEFVLLCHFSGRGGGPGYFQFDLLMNGKAFDETSQEDNVLNESATRFHLISSVRRIMYTVYALSAALLALLIYFGAHR